METPAWVVEKYIRLLSPFLKDFEAVTLHRSWKFDCPLCNDKRQRGYIFRRTNSAPVFFYCHNESKGHRFETFLKAMNPSLHMEFRKEILQANRSASKEEALRETEEEPVFDTFKQLKAIADLDPDHPARQYVKNRLIPEEHYSSLFYAPKFKKFVNSVVPDKFDPKYDEPRLIIPCIDVDGSIIGFTGRSFDPNNELRYISISLGERRLIFGLDRIDFDKPIFIVEGPIDSLFLPNCLAAGGSAIRQLMGPNRIAVFDNEPRNEQICKLMEIAIAEGMKVVIWPQYLQGKDINDLIKNGKSVKEVVGIINQNTYDGLKAKVKFSEWKRV